VLRGADIQNSSSLRHPAHSNFQGVIITPLVGLINSLQWSYFLGSYFNSKKEFKKLFFRSKNDPKFGVKLGVKITPKKGLSCT